MRDIPTEPTERVRLLTVPQESYMSYAYDAHRDQLVDLDAGRLLE